MNRIPEQDFIENIRRGDTKAFEAVFRAYYPFLCNYATKITKEATEAEEIVQELFVRLWEKRDTISITTSLKQYLFRATKNLCLNHLRHRKIKDEYELIVSRENETDYFIEEQLEILQLIDKAIASMPAKRQEIFRLSRQQGLKYKEIAQILSISVKTVETQISLALKTLRESVKNQIMLF